MVDSPEIPETEPGGTDPRVRILLVSGSTRPGSTNTAALATFADVVPEDISTEVYTGLADIPAFVPGDGPSPAAVADLRERLAAADAVLFCSPEYAGLMPGSLKNLLEWTVGTADLHEKPVAWINVAADGRGDGAVASLRTVLGYVGAEIIESACPRITVLGAMVGPDGLVADPEVRERLEGVAAAIAGHLTQRSGA
ncbi:NADPH-dependent FMN reductase [Nocardia mexicana]|uniref:NAD(P)H-dependent FMN reductase n=1 Tax=Nocardia mexicana TaxID=279262 RepID=A0A370H7U1_9NOCA|nr:NAD(P)H-dependent oxidoreductase [Nocardia mexicana]RDI52035.1 NAD(P)H-dependent FMN reductase [Nocardia mexicana]